MSSKQAVKEVLGSLNIDGFKVSQKTIRKKLKENRRHNNLSLIRKRGQK